MLYTLKINAVTALTGFDDLFSDVSTVNDLLVPPGLGEVPPGVIEDGTHTYDFLSVRASGIGLGCFSGGSNGICDDQPDDIYEYGVLHFDYAWDVAIRQGIADNNCPDLERRQFTDGFASANLLIGHDAVGPNNSAERAMLAFNVTSVTVVPEPSSVARLLAGLGLLGCVAARRRGCSAPVCRAELASRVVLVKATGPPRHGARRCKPAPARQQMPRGDRPAPRACAGHRPATRRTASGAGPTRCDAQRDSAIGATSNRRGSKPIGISPER